MKYGLKDEHITMMNAVFRAHPEVEKVILYGSRAKGNFKSGSDIDLTIKGEKLHLKELNRITSELDDLMLPWKIDLSLFHHIDNEDLIIHINRVGVVFYQKKPEGTEW